MRLIILFLLSLFLISIQIAYAESNTHEAVTQPIPIAQLKDYENYPASVQGLINQALILTQQHLTYTYGSADPNNGGMDCSGTIYYLLKIAKVDTIPRESDQIYQWVLKNGKFYAVNSNDFQSSDFSHLKPGDLLFWSGTYKIQRTIPITHVMLYLGLNKQNQPLMFGASDGRTYQGKAMWGVSVFDFKLPDPQSTSRFVGYSCIPSITCVINDSSHN